MVSTYDETDIVYVSIRNTTMIDLNNIGAVGIKSNHTVEFLGCRAVDVSDGISARTTSGRFVVRDCWFDGQDRGGGRGLFLAANRAADVEISNVTLISFPTAFETRVEGISGDLTVALYDVTVDQCEKGFVNQASQVGTELTLEVHRPTFEGSMPTEPFVATMSGFIEVYPDTYVPPVGTCDETGAITAYWILDLDGGMWMGDGEVTEGTVALKDHRGAVVTRVDMADPVPRTFVAWMITLQASTHLESLFPSMKVGGHTFAGEEYDYWNDTTGRITLVDDIIPSVNIQTPQDSSILNTSDLRLEGRYQELGSGVAVVEIRVDEGGWTNTSFDTDGNWSMGLYDLQEGVHEVHVRVTDRAGNNRTVGPRSFLVDTVAPPLELDEIPGLVNRIVLVVSGTTEPGALLLEGGRPTTIAVCGTIELELRLFEGENVFMIGVQDVAGNVNATTVRVVLDSTLPSLKVSSPVGGSWTTDPLVTVEGTVELNVTLMIDGVTVQATSGTFHHEIILTEGTFDIHVVATDMAGNVREVIKMVHVDWTPPSIILESPGEVQTFTNETTLELSGRVEETNPFTLKVNGDIVVVAEGRFSHTYDLGQGSNSYSLMAIDLAGNLDSFDLVVVLDSVAPTFDETLEPVDGEWVRKAESQYSTDGTLLLTVTTDEETFLLLDGVEASEIGTEHGLELLLDEGENVIRISVVDRAGNEVQVLDVVVLYDTLSPALTITVPVSGITVREPEVTVVGSAPGATTVSVGGVEVTPGQDGAFEALVPLKKGFNEIGIEAWDAVGNHNSTSLDVNYKPRSGGDDGSSNTLVLILVPALAAVIVGAIIFWRRTSG
jgi:hypothetical protein